MNMIPRLQDIEPMPAHFAPVEFEKIKGIWIDSLTKTHDHFVDPELRLRPDDQRVRTVLRHDHCVIPLDGARYWFFETKDDLERFEELIRSL